MNRHDDAWPQPFDWMVASAEAWGRLLGIAREVRGADGECVDALLDARVEGGSLSRTDAEKVRSLARMLAGLGLEAAAIRRAEPELMAAMERACLGCAGRARCSAALADGTAADTYPEFCPNTRHLDALAGLVAAR